MSITDIAAVTVAVATVVGVGMRAGPAAARQLRKWQEQRNRNRMKWNALAASVEINGSDEYFYQLRTGGRVRERLRLAESRTAIRRDSCLTLEETERPAHLTISTKPEDGPIILRTGWKRRNLSPGSTLELRPGFRKARIYMKKAKKVKELPTPDSSSGV